MKENEAIKLTHAEMAILESKIDSSDLDEETRQVLRASLRTLCVVFATLEQKRASIEKLRRLLFGETEKIPRTSSGTEANDQAGSGTDSTDDGNTPTGEKKSPKRSSAIPTRTLGVSPLIRTRF